LSGISDRLGIIDMSKSPLNKFSVMRDQRTILRSKVGKVWFD